MASQKEKAIIVQGLHKTFRLPHEQHSGIKQWIINIFRKNKKKGYETQHVLKGLDFEIEKGDFFGIVGRNGSGKSTLLKTLAGIYSPDKGVVQVNGTLVPFIELGVGFNPELTGRENVFLNGALLGFSHKEMEEMYDDIVEFAELRRFMDQKLKNYSSGMQVRLAFSIAIRADGDILLLDEVLAVGDEAFQRKCYSYFAELKKRKKTVILVTHSMESVQQFCNKAMMIEKGVITESGSPATVAQKYSELFLTSKKDEKEKKIAQNDMFDIQTKFSKNDKRISIQARIIPRKNFEDPVIGALIQKQSGEVIWRWASDDVTEVNEDNSIQIVKGKAINLDISLHNILPSDAFSVTILARKHDKSEEYARFSDIIKFENYSNSIYDKYWKMNETVKIVNEDT